MAAADIIKIFKENLTNGSNNDKTFCAICLRTERNLTDSVALEKCRHKARIRAFANKKLCYMCEAQVSKAWHTLEAVTLAATVNRWYEANTHNMRTMNTERLEYVLRNTLHTVAFNEDAAWSRLRARSALALTEPLRVTSEQHTPSNPVTASNGRNFQLPETNKIRSRSPEIDNIVIIDDDEPSDIINLDKLLSTTNSKGAILNGDTQQTIMRDPNAPNCFILYPMMKEQNGNVYVPLFNTKMNQQIQSEQIIKDSSCHNRQPNVKFRNKENVRIHEPKLVINGTTNHVVNPEPLKVRTDLGISEVIPKIMAVEHVKSGKEQEPVKVKSSNSVSCNTKVIYERGLSDSDCAKHPVMSDKVDWEDKIPMDVISFVDATDPNAEQFINTKSELDPIRVEHEPEPYKTHVTEQTDTRNGWQKAYRAIGQLSDEKDLLRPVKTRPGCTCYKKPRLSLENDSDQIIDLC